MFANERDGNQLTPPAEHNDAVQTLSKEQCPPHSEMKKLLGSSRATLHV